MSARPDLERVVTDWLNDEAVSTGSDRVLAATVVRVAGAGQERTTPLLRTFEMHTFAKLAIGAAAVLVVAVVGLNLLPGRDGGVGGPPIASPSPTVSQSPPPSPSPSPVAVFPSPGPLTVGRHTATLEGVPLSFELANTGWTSTEYFELAKGSFAKPDGSWLIFWESSPDNVYADPCNHTPLKPAPTHSAAALAAAVATLPGTDLVDGPSTVTIGGRPATYVAIKIRDDIDCEPNQFYRWYDDASGGPRGGYRYAPQSGATVRVWIIDVDGKLVWIDGETYRGADPERGLELQRIIDSIEFD